MKKNQEPLPVKEKYPLASAWRRIGVRFLDMLIVSLVSIGIFCALLVWNVQDNNLTRNPVLFRWMFLLSVFLSYGWCFLYFIVIPYFWKGYTLFKKLFKLKTHELIDSKKFFLDLIKKECMLWMPIYVVMFCFACVLFAYQDDPYRIINLLITYQFVSQGSSSAIFPIFQFLFIIAIIPITFITIHMAINNKKRALHDYFSNTCVVYLVPITDVSEDSLKINKITTSLNLPGLIDEEALGEANNG